MKKITIQFPVPVFCKNINDNELISSEGTLKKGNVYICIGIVKDNINNSLKLRLYGYENIINEGFDFKNFILLRDVNSLLYLTSHN